jgi:hypothetical protein
VTSDANSPLSEFWRFAGDFRSLTAWMAKGVVAAPFLDMALQIGPPWYSRIANSAFLSVFVALIVMFSFEFLRKKSRRNGQRVFIFGCAFATVLFVLYVCTSAFFVTDADDQGSREIIGFRLHDNVRLMVESDPSKWTPKELLLQFHDPMEVWTRNSVITMRVVLLLLWLAMWAAIAVGMAAFVSLQWKVSDRKSPTKSQ